MTISLPAPQPAPWVLQSDASDTPVYTRQLAGSELYLHGFSKATNGFLEVCTGVQFTSTLPKEEVHARARRALGRLRFDCPLIAGSITDSFQWAYTPVRSDADRNEWLNAALVFEDKGDAFDLTAFIDSLTENALPYQVDGKLGSVIFRCFLIAGSSSTFGLVLHAPHALMDSWPSLNVLSRLFGWMSGDIPLDEPEWGTEWKNLPQDIVTATGGPSPTWETDNKKLFGDILADRARESICLTPGPDPEMSKIVVTRPGDAFRIRYKFTEAESKSIVDVAKKNGCTVSHLLEAAHCLALAACNPPDPNKEADFVSEMTVFSLEPRLPKTHFASCLTFLPIRIKVTEILKHESEVERFKLTMQALKERYDHFRSNPCIIHSVAAQAVTPLPEYAPQFRTAATNLGVVENRLANSWGYAANGAALFEINEFYLANRITLPASQLHAWTFKDRVCLQVQSFSAYKDAEGKDTMIRKFMDEMMRQVRLLI